jgi:hypothetical protein
MLGRCIMEGVYIKGVWKVETEKVERGIGSV